MDKPVGRVFCPAGPVRTSGVRVYNQRPAALGLALACAFASFDAAGGVETLSFTDVATGELAHVGNSRSVAWGDFDADGRQDLFVNSWDGPAWLFRNTGAGVFESVDSPLLTAHSLGGRAAWADYDNDGVLDIYLTRAYLISLPRSVLARGAGGPGGDFSDATAAGMEMHGSLARCAAWADYDRDGFVDLYVSGYRAGNNYSRLFRNDGMGGFVDVTAAAGVQNQGVGRGVAWGDINNDGWPDLYVANGDPEGTPATAWMNRMYRNNGDGTFTNIATAAGLDHLGHSRGVAWGDFDNDGWLDLYVANLEVYGAGSANRLYRNNGDETFTEVLGSIVSDTSQTRCCAWIDADNDGLLDLYIANAGAPNRLFRNTSAGFEDAANAAAADSGAIANSAGWADFDGDGDMDVLVTNKDSANRLLRNDLDNGHHWLEVRLTGTASNRSAIGARVRAVTGGVSQIREVHSGSGYFAMHMLPVHFGLGAAATLDLLEVRWPSGWIDTYTGVQADRIIDLVEGGLPSDLNGDGDVDGSDLAILLGNWGGAGPAGDLNGDGAVDGADLAILLGDWT